MRARTIILNAAGFGFLAIFLYGAIETTGSAGAAAAKSEAEKNDLSFTFDVPDAGDGILRIALFNTPQSYKSNDPMIYKTVPVKARETINVTFADLKKGDYAVKVFQDEDRDSDLNTNIVGIPSEAYGFSANARAVFGPPDWNAARFGFKGGTKVRQIDLK